MGMDIYKPPTYEQPVHKTWRTGPVHERGPNFVRITKNKLLKSVLVTKIVKPGVWFPGITATSQSEAMLENPYLHGF